MKIVNLTPHDIVVQNGETTTVFPKSGNIARVSSTEKVVETLAGFPVSQVVFGTPEGVPDQQDGVFLLVSALVRSALPGRTDLLSPDTGKTAIRNDAGQIVAVRGFVRN